MKIAAGNIKKGMFLTIDNKIFQVVETEFNYRGRGSALVTLKLKNLENSNVVSQTVKSNHEFELVDLERKKLQFLYLDNNNAVFMDPETFQQYETSIANIEDEKPFLKEGENYLCYLLEEKILKVALPNKLKVKVIEAEEATKGNRVSAAKKPVVVEGGVVIQAPIFIKKGETIIINPETKEYLERA